MKLLMRSKKISLCRFKYCKWLRLPAEYAESSLSLLCIENRVRAADWHCVWIRRSGLTLVVLSRSVFLCSHHPWEFFGRTIRLLLLRPHDPISAGQELNDWLRIQRSDNIAEGSAPLPLPHAAEWRHSQIIACSQLQERSHVANSPLTQLMDIKVLYLTLFLTHIDLSIMYPASPVAEATWTKGVKRPGDWHIWYSFRTLKGFYALDHLL